MFDDDLCNCQGSASKCYYLCDMTFANWLMLAAGFEAGGGPRAGAGVWVVPLSVCVRPTPCFTCAANTPPREPSARPHRHVLSFPARRRSAECLFSFRLVHRGHRVARRWNEGTAACLDSGEWRARRRRPRPRPRPAPRPRPRPRLVTQLSRPLGSRPHCGAPPHSRTRRPR